MIRTNYFRHVWRTINDGNGDIKCLALQQWMVYSSQPDDELEGFWDDVEISRSEDDMPPTDLIPD